MAISNSINIVNAYQNTTDSKSQTELSAKFSANSLGTNGLDASKITTHNEKQASMVAHLFGNGPAENQQNVLKMTFQAAIDKLNEKFKTEFGDQFAKLEINQQNLDAKGIQYWSPENTSGRIVAGASNFLSGFQKVHPELEGEALMSAYMDVVGNGLQQGLNEAQSILQELNVFDGTVKDTFQKTADLVGQGMEKFRRNYLGLPPLETKTEAAQTSAETPASNAAEQNADTTKISTSV